MRVKVMITDGGPHPADKWAELSVGEILSIREGSETPLANAGRKLELKLLDVFETFYHGVLDAERAQIKTVGDQYLAIPVDGEEHGTDALVKAVIAAATGSPFEDNFKQPDMVARLKAVVRQHVEVLQDVEGGWHADGSGADLAAKWRENKNTLGARRAHDGLSTTVETK